MTLVGKGIVERIPPMPASNTTETQASRRELLRRFALGAIVAPLAGCRLGGRTRVASSRPATSAHEVEIVYTTLSGRDGLFVPAVAQASPLSGDAVPDVRVPTWYAAELTVASSRSAAPSEHAEVVLRLRSLQCGETCQPKSLSQLRSEAREQREDRLQGVRWRLRREAKIEPPSENDPTIVGRASVPTRFVQGFLEELEAVDFFASGRGELPGHLGNGVAHLDVRIDRRWQAREWSDEPLLDDWVSLAYNAGHRAVGSESLVQDD